MKKNSKGVVGAVAKIAEPLVESLGYFLWDVEYVKEGARRVLRITVDSEEGIGIDECEKMHRAIDPILDEKDPIAQAYTLEVSSPGLGRQIKNDEQAERVLGCEVNVKLYAPDEKGRRALRGELKAYADGSFTLGTDDGDVTLEVKKAAKISLADED